MIKVLRVDDRLLHGQVAQSWTSFYHIDKIFIINDEVENDEFSKVTLNLAKPKNVELLFYELAACRDALLDALENDDRVMVIVENFSDAWQLHEILPTIHSINVGGYRNKSDKEAIVLNRFVILRKEDIEICQRLMNKGVKLEIRQIPAEKEQLIVRSDMEQDNTILIVTHGNIGKELLDSASMFIKIEQQVHVIGLYADDDINDVHKKVENFISHHAAVLILTDLLSGATTRIAALSLQYPQVEVITGMNLVMLISAIRESLNYDVKTLAAVVKKTAVEDIVNVRKRIDDEE